VHPSARDQRPPLSPQDGWLSKGRQVLHFRPVRYERFSQSLELNNRSLEKVAGEWHLINSAHNILRLFRHRRSQQLAPAMA
jgi:hypothetical protein